ncbi:MAG: flagellar protein FlgN [Hahellaceae bacterium]|nr:flagellar protein FlgN [Hahellaceae bacterium]
MDTLSSRLFQLLSDDLKNLESLTQVLDKEKKALSARDSESLQQLTQYKTQLIKKLESNSQLKVRLLVSGGVKPVAGKISEQISSFADEQTVTLWHQVQSTLEECKSRNLVNAKVANSSLQRVKKMMDILRGQASRPNLYGAKGYEKSLSNTYSIAKA